MDSSPQNRTFEMGLYPFTKDQYNHIVHLLKNVEDNRVAVNLVSSASLAGMSQDNVNQASDCVVNNINEWIVDTGAINHMVADIRLLNKPTMLSREVYLPNGNIAKVTHTGTSNVSTRTSLTNVLYLPQFKFNL